MNTLSNIAYICQNYIKGLAMTFSPKEAKSVLIAPLGDILTLYYDFSCTQYVFLVDYLNRRVDFTLTFREGAHISQRYDNAERCQLGILRAYHSFPYSKYETTNTVTK